MSVDVAREFRVALESGSFRPFLDLLHDQTPWSPMPDTAPRLRSRIQLLVWLASLQVRGFRVNDAETYILPGVVVLGLAHDGTGAVRLPVARYVLLFVHGGRVMAIHGFDERKTALRAAFA